MTSEAQNTPVSTPSGPSAGLEGQDATQETQDATEAAQRRVERYEDLAVRLLELNDFRAHDRSVAARIGSAYRSLADQEHAEQEHGDHGKCEADRQAEDVDESVGAVLAQRPEADGQIITPHG